MPDEIAHYIAVRTTSHRSRDRLEAIIGGRAPYFRIALGPAVYALVHPSHLSAIKAATGLTVARLSASEKADAFALGAFQDDHPRELRRLVRDWADYWRQHA